MSVIEWLGKQEVFPRFYFLSRDRTFEIAASGISSEFRAPVADAGMWPRLEKFLAEISAKGGVVVGGISFDPEVPNRSEWEKFPAVWFWSPKEIVVRSGGEPDQAELNASASTARWQPSELRFTPSRDSFTHIFKSAKDAISRGALKKVVLARRAEYGLPAGFEALTPIRAPDDSGSFNYKFCVQPCAEVSFCGFSPERLFKLRGALLQSEALAGTAPLNAPLFSEKNIVEQELVKEYMLQCVSELAQEVEVDSQDRAVGFDSLRHICTSITARLKPDVNGVTVLRTLHPSPAVCGVPLRESYDFIREFEPFARGWYAGALGVVAPERTEFLVAIRSVLLNGGVANLYSGAGIVAQSELDCEWQELGSKIGFAMARLV